MSERNNTSLIVPVEKPESQELVQVEVTDVLQAIFPVASSNLLDRAVKAGINTVAKVTQVRDLIQMHATGLPAIINWLKNDMTLEQIGAYLELRDYFPHNSITAMAQLQERAGFQTAPIEDLLNLFGDVFESAGIDFPIQSLIHMIDDRLNGDITLAIQLAQDNPQRFADFLRGKLDLLQLVSVTSDALVTQDNEFVLEESDDS